MKRLLLATVMCGLAMGLVITASPARADDEREVEITAMPGYWIGVHAVSIDQALRSQLELDDRLIVVEVVPDSPAAKAGLKQHDILLKFGDREITSMKQLVASVKGSKGEPATIVVLRAGKEKSIEITPAKRPEGVVDLPVELPDWKPLQWWRDSDTEARGFRLVGPGFIIGDSNPLPNGVSINIRKENDKPAKITVKRGDDKWEVTEETIDELPEDLRKPIKRHLEGNIEHALSPRGQILRFEPRGGGGGQGIIHILPQRIVGEDGLPRIAEGLLERLQQRRDDRFKSLEERIESLRRDIEKLRGDRDTDDDTDADDAPEA